MDPLSLFSIGSLLIGGVSRYAQQKAQNVQAQAEQQASRTAASFDLSSLLDQTRQNQQSVDLKVFERQRQALRDRSRLLASAGEANVGGNSVLRMVANNLQDMSYDQGIHRTNLENQQFQTTQQARNVAANSDNRFNHAQARVSNPWFQAALGIGQQAPQAYSMYKQGGG